MENTNTPSKSSMRDCWMVPMYVLINEFSHWISLNFLVVFISIFILIYPLSLYSFITPPPPPPPPIYHKHSHSVFMSFPIFLSLSLCLSVSLSLSISLSLSHTHNLSHTHTNTHTLSLTLSLCWHEQGDMATITFLIQLVYQLFPSVDYRWLTKEMNTNLPLELDFKVEVGGCSLSCNIIGYFDVWYDVMWNDMIWCWHNLIRHSYM